MKKTGYALFIILILLMLATAGCKQRAASKNQESFKIVIPPAEPEEKAIINESGKTAETVSQNISSGMDIGSDMKKEDIIKGAKPEETFCDESATFGYMSCSYRENGDITVNLKNAGRTDLDGAWYKFYDAEMNLLGEDSNLSSFKLGESREFSVGLSAYKETKLVHIFPVQTEKICANKQIVIIPSNSCR